MSGGSCFALGCGRGSIACPISMTRMFFTLLLQHLKFKALLTYKEWSPINVEDMKEVESYQTQWMEVITTIKEGSNLLKIMIQIARRKKNEKHVEDKPSSTATLVVAKRVAPKPFMTRFMRATQVAIEEVGEPLAF